VFMPEFKGPVEGWVVNHLTTNYWRVQATMSRVEVLQEANLIFLRTAQHYDGQITEAKHFMSLFQRSWLNHFTDLAKADSANRQGISMTTSDGTQYDAMGETENMGYLKTLLRQAPREVSVVLNLLLNAPQELLDAATENWRRSGRHHAGGNKQVSMWLGLPEGSRPLDVVEEYFKDQ
jgi:hypothetical protein